MQLPASLRTWLDQVLAARFGAASADDARHEILIRFSRYQDVDHPKALLLRIAQNLATNARARTITRHRYAAHFEAESFVEYPSQPAAVLLRQIVLGLPEPVRDVFVLSRFEGLSNAEIAERLGISVKTVEARMTKALAHCAAQLRP